MTQLSDTFIFSKRPNVQSRQNSQRNPKNHKALFTSATPKGKVFVNMEIWSRPGDSGNTLSPWSSKIPNIIKFQFQHKSFVVSRHYMCIDSNDYKYFDNLH